MKKHFYKMKIKNKTNGLIDVLYYLAYGSTSICQSNNASYMFDLACLMHGKNFPKKKLFRVSSQWMT